LEENLEGNERIDLKCPVSVDSSVATASGYIHLHESSFAKQALAEALKSSGWQCEKYL
jgi:hypothetical protein